MIETDYLAFCPQDQIISSLPPSRAPDNYLQTVVARACHLQFDTHMHGFLVCSCIACVLAERPRSAPGVLPLRDGRLSLSAP
eukprot:1687754-Pleurochrysis_carterae.AAC.1